jgi:GGDEF domain-containing protein
MTPSCRTTLLQERLRNLITRAPRRSAVCLHLLDLDGFKAVNDLLAIPPETTS